MTEPESRHTAVPALLYNLMQTEPYLKPKNVFFYEMLFRILRRLSLNLPESFHGYCIRGRLCCCIPDRNSLLQGNFLLSGRLSLR